MTDQRFDLIDALAAMLAERGKITHVRVEGHEPLTWEELLMVTGEDGLLPAEIGRTCETCDGGGEVIATDARTEQCLDCDGEGIQWSREY